MDKEAILAVLNSPEGRAVIREAVMDGPRRAGQTQEVARLVSQRIQREVRRTGADAQK